MDERSFTFGRNTGTPFDLIKNVKTIAMRGGSFVDAIIIDGMHFGGQGGNPTATLYVDPDDYISTIWISSGNVIDFIKFQTHKGQELQAGGHPHIGGHMHQLDGKLTGLAGQTGYFQGGPPLVICRLTAMLWTDQQSA